MDAYNELTPSSGVAKIGAIANIRKHPHNCDERRKP
jgi:hypothetical protein